MTPVNRSPQTDEAIVREVMADKLATPREKDLAKRVHKLICAFDEVETDFYKAIQIVFGVGRRH